MRVRVTLDPSSSPSPVTPTLSAFMFRTERSDCLPASGETVSVVVSLERETDGEEAAKAPPVHAPRFPKAKEEVRGASLWRRRRSCCGPGEAAVDLGLTSG